MILETEQTRITQTTIRNQFMAGIYICPINFRDVWTILRRGKQPRAVDCFMHENVAVVIVRLAIKAATLAITRTGQNAPPADNAHIDHQLRNTKRANVIRYLINNVSTGFLLSSVVNPFYISNCPVDFSMLNWVFLATNSIYCTHKYIIFTSTSK